MYNTVVYVELRPDDTILQNSQQYLDKVSRKKLDKGGLTYMVTVSDRTLSSEDNRSKFWSDGIGTEFVFSKLADQAKIHKMTPTTDGNAQYLKSSDCILSFAEIIRKLDKDSMLVLRGHGSPDRLGDFQARAVARGLVKAGLSQNCFINLTGCKLGLSPQERDRAQAPDVQPGKATEVAEQISRGSWARVFAEELYASGRLRNRIHARLRNVSFVRYGSTDGFETREAADPVGPAVVIKRPVAIDKSDSGRKLTKAWEGVGTVGKLNHQALSKIVINTEENGNQQVSFYKYHANDFPD